MSKRTDVVVIGAGPYGLSLGAHLAATGLRVRQFGRVMQAWKTMPKGMYLKSQGFASSLSAPDGTHTLQAYCARTDTPYADYGLPVALDTFVAYGEWFARERVPGVEEVPVVGLGADVGGFRVELGDGEVVTAARVVVAVGITGAAAMPPELADLPAGLASPPSAPPRSSPTPPGPRSRPEASRIPRRGPGPAALLPPAPLDRGSPGGQFDPAP